MGDTFSALANAALDPATETARFNAVDVVDMAQLTTMCNSQVNGTFTDGIYTAFMSKSVTPIDRLLGEAARRKWTDAELCRRLRVSQQRLNNWKSRGLPADAAVLAATRLSLSLDFLMLGHEDGKGAASAAHASEPLTLYSTTPDRQTRVLDLFDQLTPAQQDEVLRELEAHVAANVAVVKHFSGKKLRPTENERIEQAFGMPAISTKEGRNSGE